MLRTEIGTLHIAVASRPLEAFSLGLMTIAFVSFTLQMKSCGIFGLHPRLPLKQCLAVESVSLLHRHCLFITNVQWRLNMYSDNRNAGLISSHATSAKFTGGKGT